MKIFRFFSLNRQFLILTTALIISLAFNVKFILYENFEKGSLHKILKPQAQDNSKFKLKSQSFKNAKVVIQKKDYFIPSIVVNGSENFGSYYEKETFYNPYLRNFNPCKYGVSGPRIICAIFTHQKAHGDTKYIQNT